MIPPELLLIAKRGRFKGSKTNKVPPKDYAPTNLKQPGKKQEVDDVGRQSNEDIKEDDSLKKPHKDESDE